MVVGMQAGKRSSSRGGLIWLLLAAVAIVLVATVAALVLSGWGFRRTCMGIPPGTSMTDAESRLEESGAWHAGIGRNPDVRIWERHAFPWKIQFCMIDLGPSGSVVRTSYYHWWNTPWYELMHPR